MLSGGKREASLGHCDTLNQSALGGESSPVGLVRISEELWRLLIRQEKLLSRQEELLGRQASSGTA